MLALRLGLAQCLAHITGIGNGLATNLEDYVAGLKASILKVRTAGFSGRWRLASRLIRTGGKWQVRKI